MARTMQKKTVTEEVQPTKEETVTTQKREFAPNDGIQCHSVIQGGLYFTGNKTGMFYSFSDYGDITDIEYRDLVAAVRTKSAYIYNPYFVIDDEDFIAEFPTLKSFYEEKFSVKDLKDILNMSISEMTETIKKLPPTAIDSLKKIAATQVGNGKLDSVKKIKTLDELFGTDLNLIGELFVGQ